MAVPATQNSSLYCTDMASHPCEGRERLLEALCKVPEGLQKCRGIVHLMSLSIVNVQCDLAIAVMSLKTSRGTL